MSYIKGAGAPTRKTYGATGDIYTDTNTGKRYECIFAYRDNPVSDYDCQWKELKTEKNPSGKISEKQPKVEEKVKEEQAPKTQHRNRTNYSSYSRQKQSL